jgi:ABC-type branched-subunit amino acid transport system ATPase component
MADFDPFGLLKPSNGNVRLGDKEITGLPPSQIVRHGLCYVPQVENVFPSLTVKEYLNAGNKAIEEGQ